MIKPNVSLFSVIALLCSCSSMPACDFVEAGFEEIRGNLSITPRFVTGVKAKCVQDSSNVCFDIYPGADRFFEEDWSSLDPHCGSFYLKFRLFGTQSEAIKESFFLLEDFPNNEKYRVEYVPIPGSTDGWTPRFKQYRTCSLDLSAYSGEKNFRLGWALLYCDDLTHDVNAGALNAIGGSSEATLHMDVTDEKAILKKD